MSALEDHLMFQIRAVKLPEPVREFRFNAQRKWRADLAWPEHKLLVEVEGGTFVRGRHSRGLGFEADCEKYAEAIINGWRVLRVTHRMVADGRAISFIERAIRATDNAMGSGLESSTELRNASVGQESDSAYSVREGLAHGDNRTPAAVPRKDPGISRRRVGSGLVETKR